MSIDSAFNIEAPNNYIVGTNPVSEVERCPHDEMPSSCEHAYTMSQKAIILVHVILMLNMGLCDVMASEKGTILNTSLVGHWKGDGKIIVAWCEATHLSFDLHIDEHGNVTGTIGDATLAHGRIRQNNIILRWLGNREYIIEAHLVHALIQDEGIQRESIRLFLDFNSSLLTGGFHTSGSKFGGKDTMVLSGIEITLSKVMPNTNEFCSPVCYPGPIRLATNTDR